MLDKRYAGILCTFCKFKIIPKEKEKTNKIYTCSHPLITVHCSSNIVTSYHPKYHSTLNFLLLLWLLHGGSSNHSPKSVGLFYIRVGLFWVVLSPHPGLWVPRSHLRFEPHRSTTPLQSLFPATLCTGPLHPDSCKLLQHNSAQPGHGF